MRAYLHLTELLNDLVKQASESEWLEFKLNYHSAEEIGERLSALSNGACLHNQPYGYLIFGANEEIGKVLRKETRMYSEIAIREWIANALIHQDFGVKGFPMVEIFPDRIEISNAGTPLITPERFIDAYLSRNEKLADWMRRMGFCEEKGSGLDKVIFYNEWYQLPAINVLVNENRTTVIMYNYKTINDLDKKEKIRACYQHACLKYVSNEKMNNQSLRERFKIEEQNAATASRIIRDAIEEGVIKKDDPDSKAPKYASYIPFWA